MESQFAFPRSLYKSGEQKWSVERLVNGFGKSRIELSTNTYPSKATSMASRININRVPQSYTPAYDAPRQRSYVQDERSFQEDPVAKIRAVASKVEDYVDQYSQPLRPHLPNIGRFLIVVTFLEDALRIITQWSDQIWYLQKSAFSASVRGCLPVLIIILADIATSLGVSATFSFSSTSSWV